MHTPRLTKDADAWHLVIFFAIVLVFGLAYAQIETSIKLYQQGINVYRTR
jgi:hypothetical protein